MLLFVVIAPKKDLVAVAAREALAEKATGKRKWSMQAAEKRDLRPLRRGPSTPLAAPSALAERVWEGLPDLLAMMTLSLLLRFIGELSSHHPKAAWERIRGTMLPEDKWVLKQADPKGLIVWSYTFSDFVNDLLDLFSYFPFSSALLISFFLCSSSV